MVGSLNFKLKKLKASYVKNLLKMTHLSSTCLYAAGGPRAVDFAHRSLNSVQWARTAANMSAQSVMMSLLFRVMSKCCDWDSCLAVYYFTI